MTQIISVKNNGSRDGTLTGLVQIGNNVCPDTITADAVAVTLSQAQLNKYNYYTISRDDANTDEFDLPDLAEIGTQISFITPAIVEIRTTTEAHEINGVASKGITTTAGDLFTAIKISATEWYIWKQLAADGAVTDIVPDVAA